MSELVERLKARQETWHDGASQSPEWGPDALCQEAAAEITRLQKELETAREALERIVAPGTVSGMHAQDRAAKLQFIAWRALQDKEVAG